MGGLLQFSDHIAPFFCKKSTGFVQAGLDFFSVTKHFCLLLKFLLFTVTEARFFQLIILELHVIQVFVAFLLPSFEVFQLFTEGAPALETAVISLLFLPVMGYGIQHIYQEMLPAHQEILVLGMDIYDCRTKLFEQTQGHWRVINKGSALPCKIDFTANETFLSIEIYIVFLKKAAQFECRHIKSPLNNAFLFAGFYGFGIGTLPHQQS